MGMERVQVVQPTRATAEAHSLSLCSASKLHRSPQVITSLGRGSSSPESSPSNFGSGSLTIGSEAGPVTYARAIELLPLILLLLPPTPPFTERANGIGGKARPRPGSGLGPVLAAWSLHVRRRVRGGRRRRGGRGGRVAEAIDDALRGQKNKTHARTKERRRKLSEVTGIGSCRWRSRRMCESENIVLSFFFVFFF